MASRKGMGTRPTARDDRAEGADVGVTGADLIAAARAKHPAKGWTAEHDDGHAAGELAMAAACYAAPNRIYIEKRPMPDTVAFVDPWPFAGHGDMSGRGFYDWDKRKVAANYVRAPDDPRLDRIELLVAAGALIAAEIDRLRRMDPSSTGSLADSEPESAERDSQPKGERDV